MLILTRHLNQVIMLGAPYSEEAAIEITAVEASGNQVCPGIIAPHSMSVHRKEGCLTIQQEGRANAPTHEVVDSARKPLY